MTIKPSIKIIADHLRSSIFMISDGLLPSNDGRGYILRRIIRRAVRHIHKLNYKKNLLQLIAPMVINKMSPYYPEILEAKDLIIETLKNEEEKFKSTIDVGIDLLNKEMINIKSGILSGKIAFKLYDTYGFPIEIIEDILIQKNLTIDMKSFNEEMKKQKERAKKSWVGSGDEKIKNIYLSIKKKIKKTEFIGYNESSCKGEIISILKNGEEVTKIKEKDKNVEIFLDKTVFYPTSGGQEGDQGKLKNNNNELIVKETKKIDENLFSHVIGRISGSFKIGDIVEQEIDVIQRQLKSQNHSATHLLHLALKNILGNHVTQKGSNIFAEGFTFDFNHLDALSKSLVNRIENLVNFYIRQASDVKIENLSISEARKKGAVALFGEKYTENVRVLSMAKLQDKFLSIELCGGTHVNNTGNIGLFKIISEKSIAYGIRRIEAKTGYFAFDYLRIQEERLNTLLTSIKSYQSLKKITYETYDKITGFRNDNIIENSYYNDPSVFMEELHLIGSKKERLIKEKNKVIEGLKKDLIYNELKTISSTEVNSVCVFSHLFTNVNSKDLRNIVLATNCKKEFSKNSVILFFSSFENKLFICIAISSDLKKINANALIKKLVEKKKIKTGGGRIEIAMGNEDNFCINKTKDIEKTVINYLKNIT